MKTLRTNYSENLAKEETYVYLIILCNEDEMFLKIGIAKNCKNRYKDYKKYGYYVLVVEEMKCESRDEARMFEILFHMFRRGFEYEPKIKFEGHTECFTVDSIILNPIKNNG